MGIGNSCRICTILSVLIISTVIFLGPSPAGARGVVKPESSVPGAQELIDKAWAALGEEMGLEDVKVAVEYFEKALELDPKNCDLLAELFDGIVISGEEGFRKPDPRMYALGAARAGVEPTDCVFVDDLAFNLPPAQELGMAVVHHTGAETTLAELGRLVGCGRLLLDLLLGQVVVPGAGDGGRLLPGRGVPALRALLLPRLPRLAGHEDRHRRGLQRLHGRRRSPP